MNQPLSSASTLHVRPWLARLHPGLFAIPLGILGLDGAWQHLAALSIRAAQPTAKALLAGGLALLALLSLLWLGKALRHGSLLKREFEVVDTLEEALALASGDILVATADRPATPLSEVLSGGNATLVVGPEGDFTDAELEMALQRGAYPVSLGDATLRSEVAALVGLACVRYELGKAAKCR